MTGKEFRYVASCVENEGFHYCFHHYANFDEIEDEEFHRLRNDYLEATRRLAEYIGVDEEL